MSETQVESTFGIALRRGDGASPEVMTDIAEVVDVDVPGFDRNMIDATHHASPSDMQEFISGLRLAPTFTATINWLPANVTQSGLITAQAAGTNDNYEIAFPDTGETLFSFAAKVKTFKPGAFPVDGKMSAQVTFQTSGPITVS